MSTSVGRSPTGRQQVLKRWKVAPCRLLPTYDVVDMNLFLSRPASGRGVTARLTREVRSRTVLRMKRSQGFLETNLPADGLDGQHGGEQMRSYVGVDECARITCGPHPEDSPAAAWPAPGRSRSESHGPGAVRR